MKQRYYTLDEFLLRLQPSQRYTRIIYFDFRRKDLSVPFRFKSLKLLYIALTILLIDCICNVVKISAEIRNERLLEAKQIGAVWSIEFLCFMRGVFLFLKHREMLEICNDLDQIFPRDCVEQIGMNCKKFARYLLLRYRVLFVYGIVGLSAFIGIPLLKYFLFYEGGPIIDEYHQHASWFPLHLKEDPGSYPYMYVWETIITIFGINCLFTWDHIYTVCVIQFVMQFEFVNSELGKLNARNSADPDERKRKEFYLKVAAIIKHHQHLQKLGDKLRNTYSLSLFLTNLLSGASICFHIYLMVNSDDFIAIILFIFPCFVQVAFTFDNCYQGSRIEEATSQMGNALFEQNWYDGSLQYRKLVLMLLQFAGKPFSLSAHNLFHIDMVHFKSTMMVAYKMFAFLQSCGTKNS